MRLLRFGCYALRFSQDAGDWPSLLSHPTKTHIFRSLVRAAGGVDCLVPVEATGESLSLFSLGLSLFSLSGIRSNTRRRPKRKPLRRLSAGRRKPRKGRRDFEERLIAAPVANSLAAVLKISASNARLAKVPASFDKELKRIARSLTETLRRDPFNLPFNAYASAGLQVLLLVLRATDQEGAASLPLVASNAENARHNTLRRRSSTSVLHATENDAEILQEFLDALLGFPKEKEGTAEDARGGKKRVCEVAGTQSKSKVHTAQDFSTQRQKTLSPRLGAQTLEFEKGLRSVWCRRPGGKSGRQSPSRAGEHSALAKSLPVILLSLDSQPRRRLGTR